MKWTLSKAVKFVQLNDKYDGKYKLPVRMVAAKLGCSKAAVQSMRRKATRLDRLGVLSTARLARLLLVPDYIVVKESLSKIEAHSLRSLVEVRAYVRHGRVTGRKHLVGEHKRNIASTAAEVGR